MPQGRTPSNHRLKTREIHHERDHLLWAIFNVISGLTTLEALVAALPIPTVYRVLRCFTVLCRLFYRKSRMTMCFP